MRKYKEVVMLLSIELISLIICFASNRDLEMFFMIWIFILTLITVYGLLGKPEKNLCTETPDKNFLNAVRMQFTIMKNYTKLPNVVRQDLNVVSLILIFLIFINIIGLILVSIL